MNASMTSSPTPDFANFAISCNRSEILTGWAGAGFSARLVTVTRSVDGRLERTVEAGANSSVASLVGASLPNRTNAVNPSTALICVRVRGESFIKCSPFQGNECWAGVKASRQPKGNGGDSLNPAVNCRTTALSLSTAGFRVAPNTHLILI